MSKEIRIDVGGVSITLTEEQVADINFQQSRQKPVVERIQTFNDIILESGKPAEYFTDSSLSRNELGYRKYVAICKVYNEGWIPNFYDTNEHKYCIYGIKFDKENSVFGCAVTDYDGWLTGASGSSRLCLKSRKIAEDIAKKFLKELNEFWC